MCLENADTQRIRQVRMQINECIGVENANMERKHTSKGYRCENADA